MANNNVGGSKHTVSEVYESSSKFESNQSVFTSSINGDAVPKYKMDSFSLQSEKQSKQIGRNAPVQVRRNKFFKKKCSCLTLHDNIIVCYFYE